MTTAKEQLVERLNQRKQEAIQYELEARRLRDQADQFDHDLTILGALIGELEYALSLEDTFEDNDE